MNAPVTNARSLDDILDGSVEDLVDLKEFKPLPIGEYIVIFDYERSADPAGIRFLLKVKEVIELANPEEAATLEPDAKESILFSFFTKEGDDNSFGQGRLKQIVNEVFLPVFGGDTIAQTLDASKGAEVRVVLKHRKDKNDPDKFYPEIKSFELA
jgi:hypothetical protein